MKRIIAILITLSYALFNNLQFTQVGDVPYSDDIYYTIPVGQELNYRDMHGNVHYVAEEPVCLRSMVDVVGTNHVDNNGTPSIAVWLAPGTVPDINDNVLDSDVYTFPGNSTRVPIYAPFDCELQTPFVNSNGRYIELVSTDSALGEDFKITFSNMNRWWCCRNKVKFDTYDDNGNGCWIHTIDEEPSKFRFTKGQVIGYYDGGITTAKITKLSGNTTWKAVYQYTP